MDPRLVFVHGIGSPRDPQKDLEEWSGALGEGMRRAGHSRLADAFVAGTAIPRAFADYADLFHPPGAPGGTGERTDPVTEEIIRDVLLEVIEFHRTDPERTSADIEVDGLLDEARTELVTGPETAQGGGDLARRTLNAATTLLSIPFLAPLGRWASGRLLKRDLGQVARYLRRAEADGDQSTLDQRIRKRVRAAMGAGPTIVVAHSLGTVVSYELLHEFGGTVPLFITLGSPLALRTVVLPHLRPRPPVTPGPVSRWLNFWDRDDLIVARPMLEKDIRPNGLGTIPKSSRIDSDGIWVHSARKYLAKADVGGPVAEAIAALTGPA